MFGIAMFTIVRSSRVMKNPSETTISTAHGLPRLDLMCDDPSKPDAGGQTGHLHQRYGTPMTFGGWVYAASPDPAAGAGRARRGSAKTAATAAAMATIAATRRPRLIACTNAA